MSKATLLELADRVEKASEPDREIDLAIYRAEFPFPCVELSKDAQDKFDREKAPHYMESLDAAMTLVPEGMQCLVRNEDPTDRRSQTKCYAHVGYEMGESYADAMHLALTAAALRARAQQESSDADQ